MLRALAGGLGCGRQVVRLALGPGTSRRAARLAFRVLGVASGGAGTEGFGVAGGDGRREGGPGRRATHRSASKARTQPGLTTSPCPGGKKFFWAPCARGDALAERVPEVISMRPCPLRMRGEAERPPGRSGEEEGGGRGWRAVKRGPETLGRCCSTTGHAAVGSRLARAFSPSGPSPRFRRSVIPPASYRHVLHSADENAGRAAVGSAHPLPSRCPSYDPVAANGNQRADLPGSSTKKEHGVAAFRSRY